jgi:hypothetical protein
MTTVDRAVRLPLLLLLLLAGSNWMQTTCSSTASHRCGGVCYTFVALGFRIKQSDPLCLQAVSACCHVDWAVRLLLLHLLLLLLWAG